MNNVIADIRELWFDEYRYQGPAHVVGSFALQPLKQLRVGPATLDLQGGALSAGSHVLSSQLTARVTTTIAPVSLLGVQPIAVVNCSGPPSANWGPPTEYGICSSPPEVLVEQAAKSSGMASGKLSKKRLMAAIPCRG